MPYQENKHCNLKKAATEEMPKMTHEKEKFTEKQDDLSPSTAYHSLRQTWPTKNNIHGQPELKQMPVKTNSPMLQRFAAESMREQPWNPIGHITAASPAKEKYVVKGETNSNSAVAGSDKAGPHK
ncbi:hypothetical protein MMC28_003976 [Mycoblastus sanguinarius]|nr:hypothetical protein [Mycoblastus sanguinarius]